MCSILTTRASAATSARVSWGLPATGASAGGGQRPAVTVTGCMEGGDRAAVGNAASYTLMNARVAGDSDNIGGAVADATRNPTPIGTSGSSYVLDGNVQQLGDHAGQQVE